LIDITLDPDFAQNGYFYLYYSPATPARFRVSRFTHLGTSADLTSEFVVWQDHEDYLACCHYGGGLDFGPDGLLYVTMGDEFVAFQGHDLRTTAGSVLRLEPGGGFPADNPFLSIDNAQPEIWIRGLRNPFRARWDLPTGRFFIGDVGGNNQATAFEEVHVATAASGGAHFGWPWCEGPAGNPDFPSCDPSLYTDPIFAYPHLGSGGSITGGIVYRGNAFPETYRGAYFYGDYTRQYLRYLTFDATGTQVTGDFEFDSAAGLVVFIEEGLDGALYYSDITGQIRRIVYLDQSPQPTCEASPRAGTAPLMVTFTCRAEDDQGTPLSFRFLPGDGSESTLEAVLPGQEVAVQHTYTQNGLVNFHLEATDEAGNLGSSEPLSIAVGTPPVITITEPSEGLLFRARDLITYRGSASDPDGPDAGLTYSWSVEFRHNDHLHPAYGPHGGTEGSFEVPFDRHDFRDATHFEITLTVTDSDQLSSSETVNIFPDKVDITFATEPAGLELRLDGVPAVAPFLIDTLIGFEHSVGAPTQCLDGEFYEFDNWSDGGTATHPITVPTTFFSLTATFRTVGPCFPTNGLVLHLAAGEGVVTDADDAVQVWSDLSISGNDLLATGDAPKLILASPSGRPAVRFDGLNDALGRSAFLGLPVADEDRSVLMVVSYTGDGSGGFTWGSASPNQAFGLGVSRGSGRLLIQGWGAENDFQAPVVGENAGWLRQTVITSSSSFAHYKDGTLIDSGSHTWATGTSKVRLGVEIDDSPKIAMEVAEILVYDRALSDAERQQVESYFEQQYFQPSPLAPMARDDASATNPGGTVVLDILHNDEDPDGDGHLHGDAVQFTSDPLFGSFTFDAASGALTYSHGGTPSTSDRITYLVTDHDGLVSNEASICIEILPGDFPSTAGRVLHFESGRDCGAAADSQGTVSSWLDISGHGNHLSTLGGPTLVPGSPGGPPFLQLDGQDDAFLRLGDLHDLPSGSADRTLIAVLRYGSNRFGGITYGTPGDPCATLGNGVFGLAVDSAGQLAVQGWCPENDFSSDTPGDGAGWLVQSVVLRDDQLQHFADGLLIDQAIHTFATGVAAGSLMIGAEIDGSPFLRLDVAALLLYDHALAPIERAAAEAYLADRYLDGAPMNQPPDASDDALQVVPGGCGTAAVLSNDTDPDGVIDPDSVVVETNPSHGTVTPGPTAGTITYCHQPTSPASSDLFSYSVADEVGVRSAPALVRVTIGESLPVTGGVVLHLESDFGVTTFGGSQVTGWLDLSGFGHDLEEAKGDPALLSSATPSGRDAIRLDGQGDQLKRLGPLTALPGGGTDRTMFVVANYRSTGFGGVSYGRPASSCATDPNRVFGLVVDNRGELAVQGWCMGFDFATGRIATGGGWLVHSAVVGGGTLAQYLNGEPIGSWLHTFNTDPTGDLVIGAEIDGSPFLDMDVAAVLVYDRALSPAERQQVEVYLDEKYLACCVSSPAPPVADDLAEVTPGGSVEIDVLANDGDGDGDGGSLLLSSIQIEQPATGGTVTSDPQSGLLLYLHQGGPGLTDIFTYTVAAADGSRSEEASVFVTIGPALPVSDGLALRLEPHAGALLSDGNAEVVAWLDLSDNRNDLLALGNPVRLNGLLRGRDAVRFDGFGDRLENSSPLLGLPGGAADRTIFIVVQYRSSGFGGVGWGTPAATESCATEANGVFALVVDNQGQLAIQGWCLGFDFPSATAGSGTGWLVQSAILSNGTLEHFRDGQVIDTFTHTFATDYSGRLVLGAEIDGTPALDMDLAAVLVYDHALSEAERQDIEAYLQLKYLTVD